MRGLIAFVFDNIWKTITAFLLVGALTTTAWAQTFQINNIRIEGNQRIETPTIVAFTGLDVGNGYTAADVNDAIQAVRASGLFETVQADLRGSTLVLTVAEFPTVNAVAFEGNNRLSDDNLKRLVRIAPRRVYSASQAEQDAAVIAEAYANQGRLSATVNPRIIRRPDNRVDVVFEIVEGGVVE
ncbi:MAG: POTRA domain-containing protein, partial [Pseudomonadota bacterium]